MDEDNKLHLGNLIIELAEGNKNALDDIYQIMNQVLYAIGNTYFYLKEDIEDSIQNLLLILLKNANKFKSNDNAYAWIIRVYVNSLKNIKKRKKREALLIKNYAANLNRDNEDAVKYFNNYIFNKELLSKLSSYDGKLVFYRYYCGFSLGEIADKLHKPKSTIQYQVDVIEEKLKNLLLNSYDYTT